MSKVESIKSHTNSDGSMSVRVRLSNNFNMMVTSNDLDSDNLPTLLLELTDLAKEYRKGRYDK